MILSSSIPLLYLNKSKPIITTIIFTAKVGSATTNHYHHHYYYYHHPSSIARYGVWRVGLHCGRAGGRTGFFFGWRGSVNRRRKQYVISGEREGRRRERRETKRKRGRLRAFCRWWGEKEGKEWLKEGEVSQSPLANRCLRGDDYCPWGDWLRRGKREERDGGESLYFALVIEKKKKNLWLWRSEGRRAVCTSEQRVAAATHPSNNPHL